MPFNKEIEMKPHSLEKEQPVVSVAKASCLKETQGGDNDPVSLAPERPSHCLLLTLENYLGMI